MSQDRRRIGTDREEAGMAERHLAGIAAQQIPARREQRPDQRLDRDVQHEGMRPDERRGKAGRGQGCDRKHARPPANPPANHDGFFPNRPFGRTSRTRIIVPKAMAFCHSEGMTITDSASTVAMMMLATSAPIRLPMPPRMVMAKALMVSVKPTAG